MLCSDCPKKGYCVLAFWTYHAGRYPGLCPETPETEGETDNA